MYGEMNSHNLEHGIAVADHHESSVEENRGLL